MMYRLQSWVRSISQISWLQTSSLKMSSLKMPFLKISWLKMPWTKRFLQGGLVVVLSALLLMSQVSPAHAASGGRIGGGSFRSAPSRSYRAPVTRSYAPSPVSPPLSPYGGGFNPFFFLPFFGWGGGLSGLFGLMVLLTVGGFILRTLQSVTHSGEDENTLLPHRNPTVSVAKIRVGLSSQARDLQKDLDRLASGGNTDSNEGLVKILQETTLALLRHPEYWCYGTTQSVQTKLQEGESQFNRMVLEERSKLSAETLSNVKGKIQKTAVNLPSSSLSDDLSVTDSRSYIVVTLIVGLEGKLTLSTVNNEGDLKQAIQLLGAVSAEQLLALEILWVPQQDNEVLTADELLAQYPDLRLV
jgi:uncharacterized membrane protein